MGSTYYIRSFVCSVLVFFSCCSLTIHSQNNTAEPQNSKHFKRLYKVSDRMYRSEQPSKKGFLELEAMGVKTILNLRRNKDDNKKAGHTSLVLKHIRLKSKEINEGDIIEVLQALKTADKPILIHCWHGSDRTGVMTAAYRIIFENWSKAEAIEEFRLPEFGYHENWYPNLLELLKDMDVKAIRTELGL